VSPRAGRSTTINPALIKSRQFGLLRNIRARISPIVLAAAVVAVFGSGATAFALTVDSGASASSGTAATATSGVPAITNTAPTGAALLDAATYNDISCTTATTCVAVGSDSNGNGVAGQGGASSAYTSSTLPATTPTLHSVSCVSSQCVAVGSNDVVTSNDGGTTWTSHSVPDANAELAAVTCPSTGLCVTGGTEVVKGQLSSHAEIFTSTDGSVRNSV
jgi:hypothetical protein